MARSTLPSSFLSPQEREQGVCALRGGADPQAARKVLFGGFGVSRRGGKW